MSKFVQGGRLCHYNLGEWRSALQGTISARDRERERRQGWGGGEGALKLALPCNDLAVNVVEQRMGTFQSLFLEEVFKAESCSWVLPQETNSVYSHESFLPSYSI